MKLFPNALILGVAVASLLPGCGDPGGAGSIDDAVIGGVIDNGDPAVVLLFAQKPNSNQGYLCSGTLISPTVVLTAAHCVATQVVGAGVTFSIFIGTDWNKPAADSWVDVKEVRWDQQFDINNLGAGHDIAVAILTRGLTITPVPINRTPLDRSLVGKPARVVGFGATEGKNRTGVGVKRTVTTALADYNAILMHVGDSTHQSCEGDSGGPALMAMGGVETLVGITSYGQVGCVDGGYHTRVDAYLPFIFQYAPPGSGTPPVVTPVPKGLPPSLARKVN